MKTYDCVAGLLYLAEKELEGLPEKIKLQEKIIKDLQEEKPRQPTAYFEKELYSMRHNLSVLPLRVQRWMRELALCRGERCVIGKCRSAGCYKEGTPPW